ncbi:MAG: RNA polymerase sigma factor, RpoD/SigA family [Cyanobacteria bacterium J06626_6]
MAQSKARKTNNAVAESATVLASKEKAAGLMPAAQAKTAQEKTSKEKTAKEKTAKEKTVIKAKTAAAKTTKKKKATKRKAKPLYTTDAVRAYLHEIGRVPLLSHEDEIVLGKQVQKMMALLALKDELSADLPEGETLADAALAEAAEMTETELSNHLRRGQRAKRKMIEANLRLVVAVAKKYQKRNLEFLDLIQEGTLGLERGVEKFDPMKGYKFSTYAYWWIRQAITRAIAQQARTIRLPIHITEKLNKIKRVQRELSQKLGRSPNVDEIGAELDLEPRQVREYLSIARQPISLDVRIGDNQDTELQDLLEDDGASPEDYTVQQSLRQDIFRMLSELTTQQQEVINLRFGLADGNPLSLAKVGQRMGISRERVRQLEQQALKHLRRRKASINGYLAAS